LVGADFPKRLAASSAAVWLVGCRYVETGIAGTVAELLEAEKFL
jgi:hypothetical protein